MITFKNLFERFGQRLEFNFFSRFKKFNKTTSIHILSADNGLSILLKILYFLLNKLNNLLPNYKIDETLEIRNFKENNLKKNWSKLDVTASPGRKSCQLFWINLPWNLIKRELNEINILDMGCGLGNYGPKFVNFSKNNINSYIGLDIKQDDYWINLKKKYPFFQFCKFNGKDFTDLIPDNTNFFITQSAIEHFEEDLSFFKQIREFICSSGKNVIQIHVFPSSTSSYLMPFHGIRQYTPRTISKIIRIFKDFSYAILFNLGGKYSNYLHYKYITKPRRTKIGDLRTKKIKEYDKLSYNVIKKDLNQQITPSNYALFIHSNWKEKISF